MDTKIITVTETKHSFYSYCDKLELEGYELLGNGIWARVYAREGEDFVIKIGHALSDGWLRFITNMSNDNPLFPRISEVVTYITSVDDESNPTGFFVARMERLEKFEEESDRATVVFLHRLFWRSEYSNSIPLVVGRHFYDFTTKLIETIRAFNSRGRIDIHEGNIMFRDKQLVITDPLC